METAIAAVQAVSAQPMNAKVAGLIALSDLYSQSGLSAGKKLPPQAKAVVQALGNYHAFMDSRVITVHHYLGEQDHLPEVQALDAVIQSCHAMVQDFEGKNLKSKPYAALMPAVSQLLIQAYQLMPMLAGMHKILVPYVFATGSEHVSINELIQSSQAKALMGAMSSIAEQDAVPRDGGAEVMRRYGASADEAKNAPQGKRQGAVTAETDLPRLAGMRTGSAERDAYARRFPSVDSASFLQDAEGLMQMLDDLSTKTMQHDFRIQRENMFVLRLLTQAMASPGIRAMFGKDAALASDARANPSDEDAALLANLRAAAGKTVGELSNSFTDFLLSEGQITQVSDSAKSVGANLSETYLDIEKGAVFRTAIGQGDSEAENFEAQKKAFNGSYDEAMAKLDEALGLGVIAKAEVAAYRAKPAKPGEAGKAQIGSKMELAKGKSMISLVNEETGKSDVDFKAPRLLESYLRLAVIDYIAMHTDRNPGNYMYNPDAPAGESVLKGIDNDMIFNMNAGDGFGQGATENAVLGAMLAERNGGQAGKALPFRTGADMKHLRGINVVQGRQCPFLISLDAFEIVTPEIKDIVLRIDPKKINEILRPYVNTTARLAVIDRIKELKAYIKTAKTLSMYHADGSVDQGNMKEYRDLLNKNSVRGLLAGSTMTMENGQISALLKPAEMSNRAGSTVGSMWGMQQTVAFEGLMASAENRNDAIKKYLAENGITMEDIYQNFVMSMQKDTRREYVALVNATEDDIETQNAKIKEHFMSQSVDSIMWEAQGAWQTSPRKA